MRICGQEFTSEVIKRIHTTLEEQPRISRRALSRQICERENWRAPNGNLQDMGCRKALLELERRGVVELPASPKEYFSRKRSVLRDEEFPPLPEVSCNLRDLGQVEIVPVTSRYSKSSRIWRFLMERFHYLGSGPLCGAQIRYLVRSSTYGWLGALSFSGASWRLKDRDKSIGWTEPARYANLRYIVCNSRFLILPTVQVPNLASHILSRCSSRLGNDWNERYGYSPVLVETFVDPERFRGSCYRAANWKRVGQSSGGRYSRKEEGGLGGRKDIYLYPLRPDWQSLLCAEPVIPLGSKPRVENPADWVEEEFGTLNVYDDRLKDRLFTLARDFYGRPGSLVPQACNGSMAKTKAAYRFFDNPQVSMNSLLKPHVEATVERIKKHPVVLAVQDTSTLDYTGLPSIEGLGPTNHKNDQAMGLILHDTMAFNLEGTPLGLLDVQCWARDPKEAGKKEKRHELPIEEKESMKWLNSYRAVSEVGNLCSNTMLVSVGDRESDIYELFYEARKACGPELLIRSERTRKRKVEGIDLWKKMEKQKVEGGLYVQIARKSSQPARKAKLEISYAEVTLSPPHGKEMPPLTLWAVYAREIDYPPDVKSPVEWMILTTIKVSNFKEAEEKLRWYALRWGIEVYHRTIKSGCRIQDRRLNNTGRLEACLAIDLVVAWRIYLLVKQGRETPDIPCDAFLQEEEWKALYAYVNKTPAPPEKTPTLREAVRMIASLGGFLGRKSDGEPGTTTLWRGLQRLEDITVAYFIGLQRASP